MREDILEGQAEQLAALVGSVMRAIFTFDDDDPTMDLPVAQLRVCNMLSDGSRTISALARELGTTVSAATQIADRLESAGMVERLPGTQDRRTRNLQLTDHGAQLVESRRQRRVRRAAEVLGALSPAMRVRVLSALRALLQASPAARADASAIQQVEA
jgi:DNA-binding MarR family transcriptional regulator